MKSKKFLSLIAVIAVFSMLLCACGAKTGPSAGTDAPAAADPAALGLKDWTMTANIWSSANGATISLTATPLSYAQGQTADFVVRLEGEDVTSNPCEWNGSAYTGYVELNAEDGYCYYVVLTGADGSQVTVDVNTPNATYNETFINMAASLESHCNTVISAADFADNTLTITEGSITIQPPQIPDDGARITCTEAALILNLDGGALMKTPLTLPEPNDNGSYTIDLAGTSFEIPKMEEDHSLSLTLSVTLSDGETLSDSSSTTWFYTDGEVQLSVG